MIQGIICKDCHKKKCSRWRGYQSLINWRLWPVSHMPLLLINYWRDGKECICLLNIFGNWWTLSKVSFWNSLPRFITRAWDSMLYYNLVYECQATTISSFDRSGLPLHYQSQSLPMRNYLLLELGIGPTMCIQIHRKSSSTLPLWRRALKLVSRFYTWHKQSKPSRTDLHLVATSARNKMREAHRNYFRDSMVSLWNTVSYPLRDHLKSWCSVPCVCAKVSC